VCSPNAAIAYDYFIGKGLTSFQAAGIVGNLQVESYLNPKNDVPDPTKTNPLARGRGIASWGPPRWQNLIAFAGGRDPWAFDTQLDFLWSELQSGGYGLQDLRATATPEDATVTFQNLFEHPDPARAHTDRRIAYANNVLDCMSVKPPLIKSKAGVIVATVGLFALVTAAGYGIVKLFVPREEPEPLPLPPLRPSPFYRRRPF
jgi:hypothetical protein